METHNDVECYTGRGKFALTLNLKVYDNAKCCTLKSELTLS